MPTTQFTYRRSRAKFATTITVCGVMGVDRELEFVEGDPRANGDRHEHRRARR
jgi:hypothetical protein